MSIELRIQRGYVSATVAATIMGVTRQRMHQLLKAGRIRGAFLMDVGDGYERWVVPRNQLKPKQKGKPHADSEGSGGIPPTIRTVADGDGDATDRDD